MSEEYEEKVVTINRYEIDYIKIVPSLEACERNNFQETPDKVIISLRVGHDDINGAFIQTDIDVKEVSGDELVSLIETEPAVRTFLQMRGEISTVAKIIARLPA